MTSTPCDALVVGAGVVGLAAACQLRRMGARRVKVVEQFALGHARGSSHGASRITRSSYGALVYAQMMRIANAEDWPRLERESGMQLIHGLDGCFFGPPDGPFEEFARVVKEAQVDVEQLDVAEARRRFPQFRFENCAGVLADHTAGVIAAADTLTALRRVCQTLDVEILENVKVESIDPSGNPIRIVSAAGTFEATSCVVAAGPWIGKLFPSLTSDLTPVRQTIGYFHLDSPLRFDASPFPVWVYLGSDPNGTWYGLPPFGGADVKGSGCVKAAHHVTEAPSDDPDVEATVKESDVKSIAAFLEGQLTSRVAEYVHSETCFYTCTPNEDFLLDAHPANPRLVIASPCSGHGFKFAPLTGRIAAELALDSRSTVKTYSENRTRFSIPRRSGGPA